MKSLDRSKKIKVLKALAEGKLNPEALQPGRFYCFTTYLTKPGLYFLDDKEYTEAEYNKLCKEIIERNNNSIIWEEGKAYHNTVIEFEVLDHKIPERNRERVRPIKELF